MVLCLHIDRANPHYHYSQSEMFSIAFFCSYHKPVYFVFCLFVYHILVCSFLNISGRVMKWSNSPPSCTEPLRRVQSLKFRSEEQSDLNDILLRVSAFGLFVYAVFSVIAGGMGAFTHEPNLLVMITGCLSVLQVNYRYNIFFCFFYSYRYLSTYNLCFIGYLGGPPTAFHC